MKKRWKILVLGFFLVATILLIWHCQKESSFEKATGGNRFSVSRWQIESLGRELVDIVTPWNNGKPSRTPEEEARLVLSYFSLVRTERELERTLERNPQSTLLLQALRHTKKTRENLEGDVEKIMRRQVTETLKREGIKNPWYDATPLIPLPYVLLRMGTFFPPVNFELEESPKVLTISYRDRLETKARITLKPSTAIEEIERIETEIETLGYDALVVSTSGVATYPSMVTSHTIKGTLSTIAHEWTHHYLTFRPMGARVVWYYTTHRGSEDIIAFNETTAAIVGSEIGQKVWEQYYAPFIEDISTGTSAPPSHILERLREIRKQVEEYLARGAVDEAETYMAEEREVLERDGYFIRKLNQSFFVWNGYYARSPAFQDTREGMGWKFLEIRAQSSSIREFLEETSNVTNRQELERLLTLETGGHVERHEDEIIDLALTLVASLILALSLFFLILIIRKLIKIMRRLAK